MFKKITLVTALIAASSIDAFSILVPSSTWWWQTGETALLEWDCHNNTAPAQATFAILVNNPSQTLLTGGYAVLAGTQPNDQCMTNLVPNLNVGTGYYITFTNSVNYTDVYATGENFEVKADGSPYPTGSTPAIPFYTTSGATQSTTATGASSAHTGAASPKHGLSMGGSLAFLGALTAFLGA